MSVSQEETCVSACLHLSDAPGNCSVTSVHGMYCYVEHRNEQINRKTNTTIAGGANAREVTAQYFIASSIERSLDKRLIY